LHHRSVDSCAVSMADSLASKAGRTRLPVVGRWPGRVLSSFVTANLESDTNFLRPDIALTGMPAAVLIAARRLATSTRKALTFHRKS
jgi:hypothetical protein